MKIKLSKTVDLVLTWKIPEYHSNTIKRALFINNVEYAVIAQLGKKDWYFSVWRDCPLLNLLLKRSKAFKTMRAAQRGCIDYVLTCLGIKNPKDYNYHSYRWGA